MCLRLRSDSTKPLNNKKIRWKLVGRCVSPKGYYAPYQFTNYKTLGWNKATETYNPTTSGFHVFISRSDARRFKKIEYGKSWLIKKVGVGGFLRSGNFGKYRSETWSKMKFI